MSRSEHGPVRFKRAAARHEPVSALAADRFEARGLARHGTIRPFLFIFKFLIFLKFLTYFYLFLAVLVLVGRIRARGPCLNPACRAIFVLMGCAERATKAHGPARHGTIQLVIMPARLAAYTRIPEERRGRRP